MTTDWPGSIPPRRRKCVLCGEDIEFNRTHWRHVGHTPKHPAIPEKETEHRRKPMEAQKCVKCGELYKIENEYHTGMFNGMIGETPGRGCGMNSLNRKECEHLHYTCRNCGYDWCGPTLDQIEKAKMR